MALSANEIRKKFVTYFESKGHTSVPSSPIVPSALDSTLLFTNAGMNQFKGVFTGSETRSYVRAVSVQKCVRAGGKHNDLENVGYTARHHTFFEMLGNFSFGDYFKKEAISLAWDFITKELGLPQDRLHISVYQEDNEAYRIWHQDIGIPAERIHRLGEKDNFWSMGDVGPCGPCSEIYYDQGPSLKGEKVGDDGDRYLEFWNLVFMEFEQTEDGKRVKLPNPSIDTGMGLERVTALLQGKSSNYDTDLFMPILETISQTAKQKAYGELNATDAVSARVIADHMRCMTFLMAEGVFPSNEGRGYVLRRIMRRAMRHARKLGMNDPVLHHFSRKLVAEMEGAYPELKKSELMIADLIAQEEQRFSSTIDKGLSLLATEIEKLAQNKQSVLPGSIAFKLYDTYGFPEDMTADILREHGKSYHQAEFNEAFQNHREKARGSWKGSQRSELQKIADIWQRAGLKTQFLGYEQLRAESVIQRMVHGDQEVSEAQVDGHKLGLLCQQSPFYGESGGQVGDIGIISAKDFEFEVMDTQKLGNGLTVHLGELKRGVLRTGQNATLTVNAEARELAARNHTATHILHATLIEVLGDHVRQKGSMVSPERLRFDFTHPRALQDEELAAIETMINARIWQRDEVRTEVMSLEAAMTSGAMALFDEKYDQDVRVLSIGNYSKELCGGTHLKNVGDIGLFKFVKESSVSAGVRRVEAFTYKRAFHYLSTLERTMKGIAQRLGVAPEKLDERIERLSKKNKSQPSSVSPSPELGQLEPFIKREVAGAPFCAYLLENRDQKDIRDLADRLLEKMGSGVIAVCSHMDEKAFLVLKFSKGLKNFHAGEIVKVAADILGGSGGGRPDMAQAGGPHVEKKAAALEAISRALN